jgi:hypothetical protein
MQVCGCSENRQYRWKVRWYLQDPEKDQAIKYPQNRACFRSGEIRILDSTASWNERLRLTKQIENCEVSSGNALH